MFLWIELVACFAIYVVLAHVSMLSLLVQPTRPHDILSFHDVWDMRDVWYVWYAAVYFPVGPLLWRVYHGVRATWVGRLSRLLLMKAVLQVTVVPPPTQRCDTTRILWLFSCANMMFSGHVAMTMLALKGNKYRMWWVGVQAVLVVAAGMQYTSDCLVAVLAVAYVETLDIKDNRWLLNGIVPSKFCRARAQRVSEMGNAETNSDVRQPV